MWVPRGLLLVRVVSKVEMGESRRERERESNEGWRRSGSVEGCGAEGSRQDARKYPSDKER